MGVVLIFDFSKMHHCIELQYNKINQTSKRPDILVFHTIYITALWHEGDKKCLFLTAI